MAKRSVACCAGSLALDEYEKIDRKIGEGVFSEDLLATLETARVIGARSPRDSYLVRSA
jgi:hypothetical protein